MKNIILASNSIARLQLLKAKGFNVVVHPTEIDEQSTKTSPEEIVEDLALKKLDAYLKKHPKPTSSVVLCADTLIFFDNELIGKAKDATEAYETLKKLSGKMHQIYSGFAMYIPNVGIKSGYDVVDIQFKRLTDLIVMNYISTKEWEGAAGCYRIQGKGSSLVDRINGDFNVAVGLPLKVISDLIKLS